MGGGHTRRGGGGCAGGGLVDDVAVDVPPGVDADLSHQLLMACNTSSFSSLTSNYFLIVFLQDLGEPWWCTLVGRDSVL